MLNQRYLHTPDMIGSANRFLYNAGLFDVSLNELKEHLGTKVGIHVKTKMDTFKDKNTGEDRTVEKCLCLLLFQN